MKESNIKKKGNKSDKTIKQELFHVAVRMKKNQLKVVAMFLSAALALISYGAGFNLSALAALGILIVIWRWG